MSRVSIGHLRELIRALRYVISTHAADELEDDQLSVFDLENIILTGRVIERQRDEITRETKYVVDGSTLDGQVAQAVVKVGHSGRLFVITVYLC